MAFFGPGRAGQMPTEAACHKGGGGIVMSWPDFFAPVSNRLTFPLHAVAVWRVHMAGKHGKKNAKNEVIVKKFEIIEGGHHGGAWKVAYADFVTAMMAFFLLMWLLNATTEDQRKGLADYFSKRGGTVGTGAFFACSGSTRCDSLRMCRSPRPFLG
jgi:hypothetical protein